MKRLITIIIVLIFNNLVAQKNSISIGERVMLQSKILNEKRELWIHLPSNYFFGTTYENKKYNVVYLLDAEDNFTSVTGIYSQNSGYINAEFPDAIIVGITNVDRYRDFIPEHFETPSEICPSGKSENFSSFLEKEVIPMIDEKYETSPYKTLIGHSLGGLFVINTLTNNTRLFNSYIAIDPSLVRYTETQFNRVTNTLKKINLKGISLYLGIANTIEGKYDLSNVRESKGDANIHIQKILEFNEQLSNNVSQLDFKSKYYSNYSHETVPIIAELEGLQFIYRYFCYKISWEEKEHLDSKIISKIENHYSNLSDYLGYEIKMPYGEINFFAYEAMKMKNYELANQLFLQNLSENPSYWNAYDSFGDYYYEIGSKDKAVEYFEKALKLKKNSETSRKLKNLKKEL